jgi:hypothetical protein
MCFNFNNGLREELNNREPTPLSSNCNTSLHLDGRLICNVKNYMKGTGNEAMIQQDESRKIR